MEDFLYLSEFISALQFVYNEFYNDIVETLIDISPEIYLQILNNQLDDNFYPSKVVTLNSTPKVLIKKVITEYRPMVDGKFFSVPS